MPVVTGSPFTNVRSPNDTEAVKVEAIRQLEMFRGLLAPSQRILIHINMRINASL